MGYKLRIGSETAFQHVTARGVDRRLIFQSTSDYRNYLRLLGLYADRRRSTISAFCLMPNHIHLLLKSNGDMSNLIRDVHAAYARWFNAKHSRIGHLFQSRFYSKSILSNEHFLEVARYIHMNPVSASIVADPIHYPWSSMGYYCSSPPPKWLDVSAIKSVFPNREQIIAFTKRCSVSAESDAGFPPENRSENKKRGESEEALSEDVSSVIQAVALEFDCAPESLLNPRRGACPYGSRAIALLVLRDRLKVGFIAAAKILGYRSVKGADNSIRAVLRRRAKSRELQEKINKFNISA